MKTRILIKQFSDRTVYYPQVSRVMLPHNGIKALLNYFCWKGICNGVVIPGDDPSAGIIADIRLKTPIASAQNEIDLFREVCEFQKRADMQYRKKPIKTEKVKYP